MENSNYNITEHFKINEFACKNGESVPPHYLPNVRKIATQLEIIRTHLGMPIVINSAYRTKEYNKKVGGAVASQHLTASAVDIVVKGCTPHYVFTIIRSLMRCGAIAGGCIILYKNFVHYDIRGGFLCLDKR